MSKRLIINADDLGHPDGTVEAVSRLHELGVVSSTTALVNQPAWPAAAAYLHDHPSLGAGVHLVMNEGKPVLPPEQVPSLVDSEGRFRSGASLLARYGRLRPAQLRAEWRAQIERFAADVGCLPDHLDLHCHFPYVFASWFGMSLDLAVEYGNLPVRMPFDDALEDKAPAMSAKYGVPAWFIRWRGSHHRASVQRRGLGRPGFYEASFSEDGHRTSSHQLSILEALPDGVTEIVCHPGTVGWRERDFAALLGPRIGARIEELGIKLVGYGAVARQ